VVVEAEVNETNKTTRRSEWSSVLKKEKKGQNIQEKDLTGPTLLEMDDFAVNQAVSSIFSPLARKSRGK